MIGKVCINHNLESENDFPFDVKCSYFVRMCRFSAEKRVQTGEIWAFNGKRCCKRPVSDKTNLPRSDASSLKARERAQKSTYLCFSALASCTKVPRRAENKAPDKAPTCHNKKRYQPFLSWLIPFIFYCASKTVIYGNFTK